MKSSLRAALIVLLLVLAAATGRGQERVAHGGGGVAGHVYTNSLQALQASAAAGFRSLELDFCWTRDGELVLLHDWDGTVGELFGADPGHMTLQEFGAARSRWGLTHMDLSGLGAWLGAHPGIAVITDIKHRNLDGLRRIAQRLPDLLPRFIPQIYRRSEFGPARALGFERVILTLYVARQPDEEVLAIARELDLLAITMPLQRALGGLAARLDELDVFTYAHTVNDYRLGKRLKGLGVDGLYTDWLSPRDPLRAVWGDPGTEWTLKTSGRVALPAPVLCFLPPAEAEFTARLELSNAGPQAADLTLRYHDDTGDLLTTHEATVPAGERLDLDLHLVFPRAGLAWVSLDAPQQLEITPRWTHAAGSSMAWSLARHAVERVSLRGPGKGLAGQMLALLNPTEQTRSYRVARSLDGRPVARETLTLKPGQLVVRSYGFRTDGPVTLDVEGGPMLVQTLRWDAHLRFLK